MRLVKSGRWNPPVGTHGQGAHPHTEDAEEVEDLLTDILSKSAADPVQTLEVGVVKGQVVPLPSTLGLWQVPLDLLQVGLWVERH